MGVTLSLRGAARFLGTGRNPIYRAIRLGQIKLVRVGGRKRIEKVELERWLSTRAALPGIVHDERGRFAKIPEEGLSLSS